MITMIFIPLFITEIKTNHLFIDKFCKISLINFVTKIWFPFIIIVVFPWVTITKKYETQAFVVTDTRVNSKGAYPLVEYFHIISPLRINMDKQRTNRFFCFYTQERFAMIIHNDTRICNKWIHILMYKLSWYSLWTNNLWL